MKIQKDTVPAIIFELTAESYEGELIENTEADKPFEFLFGNGNLLPAFEAELLGLEAGDGFRFMLKPDEAYGHFDEELCVSFDRSLFLDNNQQLLEDVSLDNFIPMNDDEGNTLNGKVISITNDYVTLDFNHPLVDTDLYFTGHVVRVREATKAELERGDVEVHQHTLWDDSGENDPICNANG